MTKTVSGGPSVLTSSPASLGLGVGVPSPCLPSELRGPTLEQQLPGAIFLLCDVTQEKRCEWLFCPRSFPVVSLPSPSSVVFQVFPWALSFPVSLLPGKIVWVPKVSAQCHVPPPQPPTPRPAKLSLVLPARSSVCVGSFLPHVFKTAVTPVTWVGTGESLTASGFFSRRVFSLLSQCSCPFSVVSISPISGPLGPCPPDPGSLEH